MKWGWEGATVVGTVLVAAAAAFLAGVPVFNLALVAAVIGTGVDLGARWSLPGSEKRVAVPFAAVFVAAFALSEAREGRGGDLFRALILLGLAGAVMLFGAGLRAWRGDRGFWGVAAVGLLTLLGLYSAGSGSAGSMRLWFAGWLPPGMAEGLIVVIRKGVHSTFYPLLAYAALRSFEGRGSVSRRGVVPWAFAFAAVFAVFDEVRQAGVPGRGGAARDVFLDLGATALVLGVLWRRGSVSRG